MIGNYQQGEVNMKGNVKFLAGIGIAVLLVLIIGGKAIGWRNKLVELDESVKKVMGKRGQPAAAEAGSYSQSCGNCQGLCCS